MSTPRWWAQNRTSSGRARGFRRIAKSSFSPCTRTRITRTASCASRASISPTKSRGRTSGTPWASTSTSPGARTTTKRCTHYPACHRRSCATLTCSSRSARPSSWCRRRHRRRRRRPSGSGRSRSLLRTRRSPTMSSLRSGCRANTWRCGSCRETLPRCSTARSSAACRRSTTSVPSMWGWYRPSRKSARTKWASCCSRRR
mmetsp:Transcript_15418/g.33466  ORF Transcript_15418/g.33466 Transcript_15418/m.33466 type:complete len:201 (+) Transcript_15418:202-804(+)